MSLLEKMLKKQLKEKYTLDNFYLLTGVGVYVGTIVLAVILSLAFKPILLARYLMPAAVVLWLTISILINKIEDKRIMLYSFAIICQVSSFMFTLIGIYLFIHCTTNESLVFENGK